MRVQRTVVSRAFRELVAAQLPGLAKNPAYWRMLEWVLFGTWRDKETKGAVSCQSIIAEIEGKQVGGGYSSLPFLEAFWRKVTKFELKGYGLDWPVVADQLRNKYGLPLKGAEKGECRVVTNVELPEAVQTALDEELQRRSPREPVYFDDGLPVTEKTQKLKRAKEQTDARKLVHEVPEVKVLLEYLNTRPVNRFTKMVNAHLDEAYAAALAIEDKADREQQLRILRSIATQPQPFYRPSKRTVRVFEAREGLQNIRSDLRRILTQDWIELDLVSSQFAICAAIWPIPAVQEFLAAGKNIWDEFQAYYGVDAETFKQVKVYVKKALYALHYGASKKNIIYGKQDEAVIDPELELEDDKLLRVGLDRLLHPFGVVNGGKKFFKHPIIKAVYQAREEKIKEVMKNQGLVTIFGEHRAVTSWEEARQALTLEVQSIELKLLMPVIYKARESDRFSILLWQHDGFSMVAERGGYIKQIQSLVSQEAQRYGIITSLK